MLDPRMPARVSVSAEPLRRDERLALQSDLAQRGISPSMLAIIPPSGRFFQLLRAYDPNGMLLGVTSLMSLRPFVSIKQLLGEGNHVGWDTSIYYTERADRPKVAAALLNAMARRSMYYAMYFGRIDDDIRAALPLVKHRLLETDYQLGEIDCRRYSTVDDFLALHKRLRRHLRDHAKAGGTVHVRRGPVEPDLARRFSELVLATYRHHGGMGRWLFKDYARRACGDFFTTCQDAVHIFTEGDDGTVRGLQSFVQHSDRLELSEGGFDRSTNTHHAYEAIIAESVAYAVANGLEAVAYGGIWNPAKDRYCDSENRGKVYLLQLYGNALQYRLAGDRLSRWAFKVYFGGRFAGASGETTVVSRRS
ncbi:MAG: GNAT family N-acetyltransferase [Acidimicrobiia bacterium]